MTYTNEKLTVGEQFTYKGIEFICLDAIDGNYLAITAKPWESLPFDTNNRNNWRNSSLRRILNSDFLGLLDRKHIIQQTSDLIADNGDKAYGVSKDYITILSCDQYRKYRDLVPPFEEGMWTLTPWTCNTGYAHNVRNVYPTGYVSINLAHNSLGVAPVCVFSSENLKLRRQAHLVGVDEYDEQEAR